MNKFLLVATLLFLPLFSFQNNNCTVIVNSFPLPILMSGNVVCVRQGTYSISKISSNVDNIIFQAYPGEVVTLKANNSTSGILSISGDNWIVRDLVIDNNDLGSGSVPAIVINGNNVTIENNEIKNGHYNAIEIRGNDAKILNNHIHNFDRVDVDAHAIIIFANKHRTLIQNNTFHDLSGDGIHIYWPGSIEPVDPNQMSQDIQILGNTFYRGTLNRVEQAIDIKQGLNILISGNDMSGYSSGFGAINMLKLSRNVIIENNYIHDTARGFTSLRDVGQNTENLLFRDNTLENIYDQGIYLAGSTAPTFENNTLRNVEDNSVRFVTFGATDMVFRGNTIIDSGPVRFDNPDNHVGLVSENNTWVNSVCSDVNGSLCGINTFTSTPTNTSTFTATATNTSTSTPTNTAIPTFAATATSTFTNTPTPTSTPYELDCRVTLRDGIPIGIVCP